jgi:putative transposase
MALEEILRTRSIRIKKGHKLYPYCDKASLLSKNLYNVTNHHIKQVFSGLQKYAEDRYPNENKAN